MTRATTVSIAFLAAMAAGITHSRAQNDPAENKPTTAPPGPVVLVEGQAFDSLGGGVSDAIVTLKLDATGKVVGTTMSTGYGDFKLEHPTQLRGAATLTVESMFYKLFETRIELGADAYPPFVEAAMKGAVKLTGTVTAARDNAPVADAKILVKTGFEDWTGTSGQDGTFTVEDISPGAVQLIVDADGFTRHKARLKSVATAEPQIIALHRERIAELLITNTAGEPVAAVNAELLEPTSQDFRQLLSAVDGRITVRGLDRAARTLKLRLQHHEYVADVDFDRNIELPADQDRSTHTLILQPAGRIAGKVTDHATGRPLSGVRLTVGEVAADNGPRAWSDLDGAFELTGVPIGEQIVTLQVADRSPEMLRAVVTTDEPAQLNAALQPARTVTGTVVNGDDAPIADVFVSITSWREQATLTLRALTDRSGRFELADAPTDEFAITLYADGYEPLRDQVIAANQSVHRFKLEPVSNAPAADIQPGTAAPPLKVATIDGKSVDLATLRGKVVLIDFWATWCGPCVAEIPNLREVHKQFGGRDDFLLLSLTQEPMDRRLKAFIEAQRMTWHHACGPAASPAFQAYGVTSIPALFLIDRDGRLVASHLRGARIARAVADLLKADQ